MQFNNKKCIFRGRLGEKLYICCMKELAKWIWIVLIVVLFLGTNVFLVVAINIVIIMLIWWLKPEWINKKKNI